MGGTLSHHPFFHGIFHYEPTILGAPISGNSHISAVCPLAAELHDVVARCLAAADRFEDLGSRNRSRKGGIP